MPTVKFEIDADFGDFMLLKFIESETVGIHFVLKTESEKKYGIGIDKFIDGKQ